MKGGGTIDEQTKLFRFRRSEGQCTEQRYRRQEHHHEITQNCPKCGEKAHLRPGGRDGADEAADLSGHPGGADAALQELILRIGADAGRRTDDGHRRRVDGVDVAAGGRSHRVRWWADARGGGDDYRTAGGGAGG